MGGAVGADGHYVFAAQAEFVGDVDAGLIGKGHVGFEDGGAGANEVGMFVPIEADAVAETMREEFVARSITGGGDDVASGVVHGAGKFSSTGGIESGILSFADDFKNILNFLARFAENAGPGDV